MRILPRQVSKIPFFKTAVLGVTCGALHIAGDVYESFINEPFNKALQSLQHTMMDDDLILRHGSRAWGVYMGMNESSSPIAGETAEYADRLHERLVTVVDESTAAIAEAGIDAGYQEFNDGDWTEAGFHAYAQIILDTDRSMREGPIKEALINQDIPADIASTSSRVIATIDTVWRLESESAHQSRSQDTRIVIRMDGYQDTEITRTPDLHQALQDIYAGYRSMEFIASGPVARISLEDPEGAFDTPDF